MVDAYQESAKTRRKQQRKKVEIRKKEFHYRGLTLEEVQKLTLDELLPLLPSRIRRTLKRGLKPRQNKLLEDVKHAQKGDVIKTHCRDMPVLPEFIGHRICIYNGKEFQQIEIQPQMIGHSLGEFAGTRKRVKHTGPGVGATRGSKFMPLK